MPNTPTAPLSPPTDLARRDAEAKEIRAYVLASLAPAVPPLGFDPVKLAAMIREKIDRASASRDQSEMTNRTMQGIEVAEVNGL